MMIGYKTGLACTLAAISPAVAALAGWIWGLCAGGPQHSDTGTCDGCGYDLTGNRSGICPECGMAIETAPQREVEIHHLPGASGSHCGPITPCTRESYLAVEVQRPPTSVPKPTAASPKPFSEQEIVIT